MKRAALLLALLAVLLAPAAPLVANDDSAYFSGVDAMPPAERYRQLSLMLMVAEGAGDELIEALVSRLDANTGSGSSTPAAGFDFEQYTTPLIRIVDQETMLTNATLLLKFGHENAAAITSRLEALRQAHADAIDPQSQVDLAEDVLIIRMAIADSIDFAHLTEGGERLPLSAAYREHTVVLRNNIEHEQFSAELQRLTDEAVASVGGKTDAYERMFNDETDSAALDEQIKAAEHVYGWDAEVDRKAAEMAEEILENIWDQESDF